MGKLMAILANLLPASNRVHQVEHHPSLPWHQVPAFLAALRTRPGSSVCAIEFTILTAARSGMVRGLRRRELSPEAYTLSVPKERMRGGEAHRVPLSTAALALLEQLDGERMESDNLIFPGRKRAAAALSDMSLSMVL